MAAAHATRPRHHHYQSMRSLPLPLPLSLSRATRPCPTTTTTNHQISLNLVDPIDFDARVAAWEKNEAREASIMSSAATATATAGPPYAGASSYRPEDTQLLSHLSTIEPTPHRPHQLQPHHGADQVWRPNPSPHTHRTLFFLISLQFLYSIP